MKKKNAVLLSIGLLCAWAYAPPVITTLAQNPAKKSAELSPYHAWVDAWAKPALDPKKIMKEVVIPMPYYEQVDGTCWAADLIMLAKACAPYRDREKEFEIHHAMKELKLETDSGIGMTDFLRSNATVLHKWTGVGVETSNFQNDLNLRNAIIEQLDKQRPVILRLADHTILIIGYRHIITFAGYEDYEFLLHNSQNSQGETMYKSWSWGTALRAKLSMLDQILYVTDSPHPQRSLQTICMPSLKWLDAEKKQMVEDSGFLGFSAPMLKDKIGLAFMSGEADGYAWYGMNNPKKFEEIPLDQVKDMLFSLKIFNADQGRSVPVDVDIIRTSPPDPDGREFLLRNRKLTLPPQYAAVNLSLKIPVQDVVVPGQKVAHAFRVKVSSGGVYLDGFSFNFKPSTSEGRSSFEAHGTYKVAESNWCTVHVKGNFVAQKGIDSKGNALPRVTIRNGKSTYENTNILIEVPKGSPPVKVDGILDFTPASKTWRVVETGGDGSYYQYSIDRVEFRQYDNDMLSADGFLGDRSSFNRELKDKERVFIRVFVFFSSVYYNKKGQIVRSGKQDQELDRVNIKVDMVR